MDRHPLLLASLLWSQLAGGHYLVSLLVRRGHPFADRSLAVTDSIPDQALCHLARHVVVLCNPFSHSLTRPLHFLTDTRNHPAS